MGIKRKWGDYFSKAFSKIEKDSFFQYAFKHSDYRNFPEDEFKKWVFQNDKHSLSLPGKKIQPFLFPHTQEWCLQKVM